MGDEMTGLEEYNISTSKMPSMDIVVPCYNEKDAFPHCLKVLGDLLGGLIT